MEQVSARARSTKPVKGSHQSDKQIAYAVRDRRKVRAIIPGALEPVEGYVLAMDDYHWVVVDLRLEVHLVHKSVPCFTVLRQTLDDEPADVAKQISEIIRSFRDRVVRDHFQSEQTPA